VDVPLDRFAVLFQQGFKPGIFHGVRLLSSFIEILSDPDLYVQMFRKNKRFSKAEFLRVLKNKFFTGIFNNSASMPAMGLTNPRSILYNRYAQ
jgi:hypothetical protein